MARPVVYAGIRPLNVTIEKALIKAAKERAKSLHLGVSEYISRLLIRDLDGDSAAVLQTPRHFAPKQRKAKASAR